MCNALNWISKADLSHGGFWRGGGGGGGRAKGS